LIKGEELRKTLEASLNTSLDDNELMSKYPKDAYTYDYMYIPTPDDVRVSDKLKEMNQWLTEYIINKQK
jgi:hypothetical protein